MLEHTWSVKNIPLVKTTVSLTLIRPHDTQKRAQQQLLKAAAHSTVYYYTIMT